MAKVKKIDESDVIAAYDKLADRFSTKDLRDRWDYLFSKLTTDHYLLSKVDLNNKKVLNIGCSQPIDEIIYARKVREWVAIDLSEISIRKAQEMIERELSSELAKKISFKVCGVQNLPFEDERFDVVVSFSTLDHIPDPKNRAKAINEISRVTRTGGHVVITVPNRWNLLYYLWSRRAQKKRTAYFGYEYCFSPWELKKLIRKYNLEPIEFASNFIISPQIWLPFLKKLFFVSEYLGFRMGYLAEKINRKT